jgi:hypothetical protein
MASESISQHEQPRDLVLLRRQNALETKMLVTIVWLSVIFTGLHWLWTGLHWLRRLFFPKMSAMTTKKFVQVDGTLKNGTLSHAIATKNLQMATGIWEVKLRKLIVTCEKVPTDSRVIHFGIDTVETIVVVGGEETIRTAPLATFILSPVAHKPAVMDIEGTEWVTFTRPGNALIFEFFDTFRNAPISEEDFGKTSVYISFVVQRMK